MKQWYSIAVVVLLAAACNSDDQRSSSMPGGHTGMQTGGAHGTMDTSRTVRQPVHLTAKQEQTLGIVYAVVRREQLIRTVRIVGRVEVPEPAIADVTPKIEGYVERLMVNSTGESVRKGQPLLDLYSPMLVAAQEELRTARRLASQVDSSAHEAWHAAHATVEAARRRLAYWDITPDQIARIEQTGNVSKTLTLVSPVSGIVLEKNVLEGQRVMPGMRLYRIADLSTVWVEGDVYEQDMQYLRIGSPARIEVAAYPGEQYAGRVSFIYPTVDRRSRTNRVRVTVPNPGLRLKPGMYVTLSVEQVIRPSAVTVPAEAVVETGERAIVFVRQAPGMLVSHEVVVGARAGDRVQILRGLAEGDVIVASGNFLVDAESRLTSGAGAMPGMHHGTHEVSPRPDTAQTLHEHHHD